MASVPLYPLTEASATATSTPYQAGAPFALGATAPAPVNRNGMLWGAGICFALGIAAIGVAAYGGGKHSTKGTKPMRVKFKRALKSR